MSAPASAWDEAVRARSSRAHIVHDLARPLLHDPAMAVARVLAQADVGDHDQLGRSVLYGAGRELDYPLGVVRSASRLVFLVRDAEEQDRGHPEIAALFASATAWFMESWKTPGMEATGFFTSSPTVTKIG